MRTATIQLRAAIATEIKNLRRVMPSQAASFGGSDRAARGAPRPGEPESLDPFGILNKYSPCFDKACRRRAWDRLCCKLHTMHLLHDPIGPVGVSGIWP